MASNNRSNRSSNAARQSGQREARRRRQQRRTRESREQGQRSEALARRSQRASRASSQPRIGGGSVLATIRANPIPAMMIGAGLTWLLLGERIGSALDTGVVRSGRRRLGELGETFTESFGGAAEGAASTVRNSLVTIREYAQEGLGSAGEAIRAGAGGVRRAVSSTAETLSDTWDNHPLAVCTAALALGITAGMLFPSTSRENRAMGRASGALMKQARRAGTRVLERGKGLATQAVKVVGREARRQGLTPGDLGAKVKRVASKARDAVAPA